MQNGHLIEASTLKISAFLKNLILGRGFGSVFRHHLPQKANRSAVGFFIAHKLLRQCKCPMFALHYNIPQCLPPTRSL